MFAELSSRGVKDFTNNQSEAINRQFGKPFKPAPKSLINVLHRTKQFKKEYILAKAETMGANTMRKKPADQIIRSKIGKR